MLKFHAWLYRTFGYYSNYAARREYDYIRDNMQEFYDFYVDNNLKDHHSFEALISIKIGMWQCEHGFYRPLGLIKGLK